MIGNLIQRAFGVVGLRLVRTPPGSAERWRSDLGSHISGLPEALSCDAVVDVGVAGGTPWLYRRFPDAKLILIEPLNVVSSLASLLDGRDFVIFECAAGAEAGETTINYNVDRPGLSSIKRRTQLTKTDDQVIQRSVKIKTVDEIVKVSGFEGKRVALKIDTEGFELDVLKGSVETLSNSPFIVCETSIERRFEDSYNLTDIVVFLNDHGFSVTRVLDYYVDKTGYLRMADLLFEPKNSGQQTAAMT